jgi:hypothetical protein
VLATGETEKLMITELILSLFIPFTLGGGGGRAGKTSGDRSFFRGNYKII